MPAEAFPARLDFNQFPILLVIHTKERAAEAVHADHKHRLSLKSEN
jgi:hypothetical protein